MKVTWKVQVKIFKWWTTNEYTGSDNMTVCQTAMKTMENKPKLLKKLKWQVTSGGDMRSTDQEPEYEFDWLAIPTWTVIILCIIIGGSVW